MTRELKDDINAMIERRGVRFLIKDVPIEELFPDKPAMHTRCEIASVYIENIEDGTFRHNGWVHGTDHTWWYEHSREYPVNYEVSYKELTNRIVIGGE